MVNLLQKIYLPYAQIYESNEYYSVDSSNFPKTEILKIENIV